MTKAVRAAASGPTDTQTAARVSAIVGVREASRLLGTDPRTVRRMIADHRLYANTANGTPKIKRDDVLALIAKREKHGLHGGRDVIAERQARILAMFERHATLREICESERVRVEYVLEMAKLWAAGLPYESPIEPPTSGVMRSASDRARDERAERDAAASHEARMLALDRELEEQRAAAEREHERLMKSRRSG